MKYIIRDAAHASRRLGSRPAAAAPYMKDVMTMLVKGRCVFLFRCTARRRPLMMGHVMAEAMWAAKLVTSMPDTSNLSRFLN